MTIYTLVLLPDAELSVCQFYSSLEQMLRLTAVCQIQTLFSYFMYFSNFLCNVFHHMNVFIHLKVLLYFKMYIKHPKLFCCFIISDKRVYLITRTCKNMIVLHYIIQCHCVKYRQNFSFVIAVLPKLLSDFLVLPLQNFHE